MKIKWIIIIFVGIFSYMFCSLVFRQVERNNEKARIHRFYLWKDF